MIKKNLILVSLLGILSSSGTRLNIASNLEYYKIEYGVVKTNEDTKIVKLSNGGGFVVEDESFKEGEKAIFITVGGDSYMIKKWGGNENE